MAQLDLLEFLARGRAAQKAVDLELARALRETGLERAQAHAPGGWHDRALEAVRKLCLERTDFLCDDVWDYIERPPEARALGAVMREAERRGWCARTDRYKPSRQPNCHANPRVVRRSLIP